MKKYNFFLSPESEIRFLESMNRLGFEPVSASLFSYTFEKTGRELEFCHVFLKKGKKSYREFDYKSRDPQSKAVYANADRALFKKEKAKGGFNLFANNAERLLNAEQKRAALNTQALIYLGLVLICTLLFNSISVVAIIARICLFVFAFLAIYDYLLSVNLLKFIRHLK